MSPKDVGKQEYLVMNIGSGVRAGTSVTVVGVAGSMGAAKELIQKMGAVSAGKILIAEKKTVITRTPVVELKESDETILANPK
ncbi:MAG: hypothetical protein ACXW38_12865 [Nitrospira sp.]